MAVQDLYRDAVLAHNRAPRRFGRLDAPTHAADGDNPMCGDHLHCDVIVRDGAIDDLRFDGEACAIGIAAASTLVDLVVTRDAAHVAALRADFAAWLRDGAEAPRDSFGDLNALAELRRYPSRHGCALLAFATLEAALRGDARATSHHDPAGTPTTP